MVVGFITEDLLKGSAGDREGDAFQLALYTLALGLNAQLIYEIGVGQSTLALLRAVKRTGGKVVSCDTNPDMAGFVSKHAPDTMDHWGFYALTSERTYPLLEEPADLIFIDGCHSLSCVQWEVDNYWKLLKMDGLMVFHDTRDWKEGPGKVMELMAYKGYEVVELPFSCGIGVVHKMWEMAEHV